MNAITPATETFLIPQANLLKFTATINRINRRAKKLGFPEVTYRTREKAIKSISIVNESGRSEKVPMEIHTIELTGMQPVLSGWKWRGKLQHMDNKGSNVILGDVPKEFQQCPPDCDHCNTNRDRSETFILERIENGDIKQIGKSCLKDFFNGDNPMHHASMMEMLAGAKEEFAELEEYDDLVKGKYANTEQVLFTAAAIRLRDGWISSAKADELMCYSSAMLTRLIVSGAEPLGELREGMRQAAVKLANDALHWLRSEEAALQAVDSTFLHNLVTLAKFESINKKHIGILAAAIPTYDNHLRNLKARELALTSQFIGKPDAKEKIDSHPVVIVSKKLIPGNMFGDKMLYTFQDNEGNMLTWYSSGRPMANVGDRVHIAGTIHKHTEYRDVKQTELQRVTCNENKLYEAIENKRSLKDIQKILAKPINVDQLNITDQMTPLMLAAREGNTDFVQLLIEHGANPNVPCDKGYIAIDFSQAQEHDVISAYLFENGSDLPTDEQKKRAANNTPAQNNTDENDFDSAAPRIKMRP